MLPAQLEPELCGQWSRWLAHSRQPGPVWPNGPTCLSSSACTVSPARSTDCACQRSSRRDSAAIRGRRQVRKREAAPCHSEIQICLSSSDRIHRSEMTHSEWDCGILPQTRHLVWCGERSRLLFELGDSAKSAKSESDHIA